MKYVGKNFYPGAGVLPLRPVSMEATYAVQETSELKLFHCSASLRAILIITMSYYPVGIGSVEFIGILIVKLVSARDLVNADIIGKSDPYVIARLGKQTLKSKTIQNNLNPVWNETLMFSWTGSDDLLLEVFDEDLTNDDGNLILFFIFHLCLNHKK